VRCDTVLPPRNGRRIIFYYYYYQTNNNVQHSWSVKNFAALAKIQNPTVQIAASHVLINQTWFHINVTKRSNFRLLVQSQRDRMFLTCDSRSSAETSLLLDHTMKKCPSYTCRSAEGYGSTCHQRKIADSNWMAQLQERRHFKKDEAIYLQAKIKAWDIQCCGVLYKWGGTTAKTPLPWVLNVPRTQKWFIMINSEKQEMRILKKDQQLTAH
jgi:hypothetical protein